MPARHALIYLALILQACTCNKGAPIPRGDAPPVVVVDPDEAKAPPADPEKEPNDSRVEAQPLAAAKWVEGSLKKIEEVKNGDQDWYRVKLTTTASILHATLTGVPGLDLVLEAYSAGGKRLVKVNNNSAGGGEVLINLAVRDEDVFLRVREKGGKASAKKYRISYKVRDREEGEELEPNWKSAMATPLAMDEDAVGYLGWNQDNDWYVIQVPEDISADSRIRLEYDGLDNVRANLSLRDARGKVVQSRWSPMGGGVTLANLALPKGARTLHVVVMCIKTVNPESRYYLRALASVPAGPTEREPNHKPKLATLLPVGKPMVGLLADNLDHDLYVVNVAEPSMIRAEVTVPLDLDVALAVVGDDGKVIWEVNDGKRRKPEVIPALAVQPPAAYIRVRAPRRGAVSAVSPYRLKVKLTPEASNQEREPNNSRDAANPWPGPVASVRGYMHPTKDVDYYRWVAPGEQLKLVAQPPPGMKLKVELLNTAGTMVASSKQDAAFGKVRLTSPVKPDAVYYLRVSAPGVTNPDRVYQLEME